MSAADDDREDEELLFAFEPEAFRSLSDLQPWPRPSNPLAAVLSAEDERDEPPAPLFRSFAGDWSGRRKRGRELVTVVTPVVRPIPKRARLDRAATAPASFMRAPSPAGQPLSHSSSNDPKDEDKAARTHSASIAIPGAGFRPIRPASTGLVGSAHSSASSSSKSWAGNFCRRSLDVSSPVHTRLSDLVISTSGSREGS